MNAIANSKFISVVGLFKKDSLVRLVKWQEFGPGNLQVNGKIFALLSAKGKLTVRLPKERAQELVDSNAADYFEPMPGIPTKEWITIPVGKISWAEAAEETYRHVKEL